MPSEYNMTLFVISEINNNFINIKFVYIHKYKICIYIPLVILKNKDDSQKLIHRSRDNKSLLYEDRSVKNK